MYASRIHFLALVFLGSILAQTAHASVHLMQIEQVIGGVNGDVTAQAIQLRMRANGQNQTQNSRLVAWDAAGANPVVLVSPAASVANSGMGSNILMTTPAFDAQTNPPAVPDFTMNPIPAAYLVAGSLTFENASGTVIYWRLSWGGAAYSGSNMGSGFNDADGDFGPPFTGPLPTVATSALRFLGTAGALSTSNGLDYAITTGSVFFTNNAAASFLVPPTLTFQGIANVARGQAQINFIPAPPKAGREVRVSGSECLVVSNIGSSGDDGVDMQMGPSDFGKVEWIPLQDPTSMLDGTQHSFAAVGELGGVPDQPLASTAFVDVGTQVAVSTDFTPVGGSTFRVELYHSGVLVHAADGQTGAINATLPPVSCEFRDQCVPNPTPSFPTTASTMYLPPPCFVWEWETDADVVIPGQGATTADEMRLIADTSADVRIETMEIRIADPSARPPDLLIFLETLGQFGHGLRAAGDAEITLKAGGVHKVRGYDHILHNDHLVVSNIGSSGDDGVYFEADPNDLGFGVTWAPIDPGMPPVLGGMLRLEVRGSISGIDAALTSTLTGNGSGADIDFDYSAIGASTVLVEVLDNGQVVHSASGFSGSIGADAWPSGVGQRVGPSAREMFWLFATAGFTVGGTPVVGDEIRVLPEGADSVVDELQGIVVLCSMIPGNELQINSAPNILAGELGGAWSSATSLGAANATTNRKEDIVLGNIGSTGDDGVNFDIDGTPGLFRTDWAPLGDSSFHSGGKIIVSSAGKLVGDRDSRTLGEFQLENVAGTIQLTTDYSPIGATQVRVRVFDNHVTVADFVLPDGAIGSMTTWPGSCGKQSVIVDGNPTLCYWIDPGEDADVDYAGGPMAGKTTMKIPTDLIQILAVDADAPFESLDTWDMRLANIPFILLHKLAAEQPTAVLDGGVPRVNVLHPAYPNPFNARVTFAIDLARASHVTLQIVSPRGRLVNTLIDAPTPAGRQTFVWNGLDHAGRAVASGTYVVRLQAPGGSKTQKITLLK